MKHTYTLVVQNSLQNPNRCKVAQLTKELGEELDGWNKHLEENLTLPNL